MKKRSFKKKLTWITALVVTTCLTGYAWAEERPAGLKEVSYDASVGPDVITYDFRLPAFKKGAVELAKEIKTGRSTSARRHANEGVIPFSAELLTAYPQIKQN